MIATPKLKKAMREIAAQKGPFTLFGLFRRADAPGKWDLVVAAPWLEQGKLRSLSEFTRLLAASLGESSLKEFARIVTLNSNDPALLAVTKTFPVEDGEVRVQRSNLFGLDIEDAIIFRAKRAA